MFARKPITTGTYLLVNRLHNVTAVGEAIGLPHYGLMDAWATTGRPYGRVVSQSDGEVAIEKIKKPLNRRLSRQLPSRGVMRDVMCAALYE